MTMLTKKLNHLKEQTEVTAYIRHKGLADRYYYNHDYHASEDETNCLLNHDEFLKTCIEEYLTNHNVTLQEVLKSL